MKGFLKHMFGGEIPRVPSAATKDTCWTVYIVLFSHYRIFESTQERQVMQLKTIDQLSNVQPVPGAELHPAL